MASTLGIYETTAALDHDVAMLLVDLLREIESRGVDPTVATRALRRAVRGI
jgi:hypothetical protein